MRLSARDEALADAWAKGTPAKEMAAAFGLSDKYAAARCRCLYGATGDTRLLPRRDGSKRAKIQYMLMTGASVSSIAKECRTSKACVHSMRYQMRKSAHAIASSSDMCEGTPCG